MTLKKMDSERVIDYGARRQALLDKLEPAGVALIHSGFEQIRNRDVEYPFRAESDFLYLTGLGEPEAVLLLLRREVVAAQRAQGLDSPLAWWPDEDRDFVAVFVRAKDPDLELWQGRRLGVEAAPEQLQVDAAWPIEQLDEKLTEFLVQASQLWFSFAQLDLWGAQVTDTLKQLKAQVRKGTAIPTRLCDLDELLHEQRLFKQPQEVALLRQAAQISVQGHLAAMAVAQTAQNEFQLKAALEHCCFNLGAQRMAFNTIAASGENACILHYTENNAPLRDGDLVLIDGGAEFCGYAGDISHSFPRSGRFTQAQRALYLCVLRAQQAAIAVIKPGQSYHAMHEAAVQELTRGLLALGILQGDLQTLLDEQAYKPFFMHGTGHWLGLDVHDVGRYKVNGRWREFEVGMLVTVEPGLYIAAHHDDVDPKWRGIGIRIEDDVLVTEQGHEVLTTGLPRTPEEIEQWMQHNSRTL